MGVRKGIVTLFVLGALALTAAPATAAPESVPSDNSAAAQYTESLPGAEGNQTSKDLNKKQGGGTGDGTLSKQEAKRLKALGKEGAEAAELAGKGASDASGKGAEANGEATNGVASSDSTDSTVAGQPADAAGDSSDSDGVGLLLPLLGLVAVVAAGLLIWRLRVARGY